MARSLASMTCHRGRGEPRRDAPWQDLFIACLQLTTLLKLRLCVHTIEAFWCQQYAQAPVTAASIAESLAGTVFFLLSESHMPQPRTRRIWLEPRVLDACSSSPDLQDLSLILEDDELNGLAGIDMCDRLGEHDGHLDELTHLDACWPCLPGVCNLTGLGVLNVSFHGSSGRSVDVEAVVHMVLPRMRRLRCLRLLAEVDEDMVNRLASCVRDHMTSLCELYMSFA